MPKIKPAGLERHLGKKATISFMKSKSTFSGILNKDKNGFYLGVSREEIELEDEIIECNYTPEMKRVYRLRNKNYISFGQKHLVMLS